MGNPDFPTLSKINDQATTRELQAMLAGAVGDEAYAIEKLLAELEKQGRICSPDFSITRLQGDVGELIAVAFGQRLVDEANSRRLIAAYYAAAKALN